MNINFNTIPDYEERKFIPLPEGFYKTLLFSHSLTTSKNGDEMLVCEFKVLNDPTDFKDRILKEYYVLTNEISLSKLKKLLELSNVNILEDVNIYDLISSGDLLGCKYNTEITQNEYTNKYNKTVIGNRIKNLVD